MKIALIDDHPIIIDGYKAILISKEVEKEENILLLSSISEAIFFAEQCYKKKETIDVFIIDYNMPEDTNRKIKNGEDLALVLRGIFPDAKIILLTSVSTPLLLFDIINRLQPEGLWLKGDVNLKIFVQNFNNVITGGIVYSDTVKKSFKNVLNFSPLLDEYNRKLLLLLNDGVKTKNLPNFLHLSLDTINHRKANLKVILGLESADDFELVKKAKSLGLL